MRHTVRMETRRATEPGISLGGCHVLVTRPAARAGLLCEQLAALGAGVLAAPMLAIEPLPETPAMRTLVQALDHYDFVIVTSLNAVDAFMPLASAFWPQWPVAQQWLAVGAATATALARFGVAAVVPDDATSEGLLALPALDAVEGRRVLLVAGEGGRDMLEKTLAARGAQVTRIATYRRVVVTAGRATLDAFRDISAPTGRRVALVTSAEALQNLLALAPWLPGSDVVVIVASERIAAAATRAGIRHLRVADGAGDDSQLAALRSFVAEAH